MRRGLPLALLLLCATTSCGDLGLEVAWPVAYSDAPDADRINSPFGPRLQSDRLDFHAGIDIPLPEGTKIRSIKAGVVEKIEYDSDERGTGNWVLVDHGDGEKSAYLHLSKISVAAGKELYAGQVLGRSGSTGAKSPHLHLTYMRDVEKSGAYEDLAHNPLEILPHGEMPEPEVSWEADAVTLDIVFQPMLIQTIVVSGEGESRTLEYAEVLALGNPDRDNELQAGLRLAVSEEGEDGHFQLRLSPDAGAFVPESVELYDYAGELLLATAR